MDGGCKKARCHGNLDKGRFQEGCEEGRKEGKKD